MGKENVEALHLEEPASGYLGRENFVGLDKLRFLQLKKYADLGGDFGSLLPALRWLSLQDTLNFNVTNLYLRELVVLELFDCRFNESWPGWGQILISKQLKVLSLSQCNELINTPDLSEVVNLERLVLKDCDKLTSIDRSLGKLQLLTHLSIAGCHSLHDLPKELALLESLKKMIFRCSLSKKINLPESIGCLVSLTRFEVDGAANLPNSIGQLVELKHLSLRYSTNIRVIPDCIGDLRSLVSLNLLGSGITELPSTIGQLAKLESLILISCMKLQRLPDSVRNLHSLIELDVSDPLIAHHSFGKLASEEFVLMFSSFKSLSMDQWSALQQLKTLTLGCPLLEFGQCELPSNIESLYLHVKKWGKLPSNLSRMKNLRELKLGNFVIEEADWVQGLECLEIIEMRCCCLMFNEFHVVKTLRELQLDRCQIKDDGLFKVVGAEGFELSLVVLRIKNCIITCLDITQLNHLVRLRISGCKGLVDIQGIEKLKSLTTVWILGCDSFSNVDRLLSAGRTLSSLFINDCKCDNVVDIYRQVSYPSLPPPNLKHPLL